MREIIVKSIILTICLCAILGLVAFLRGERDEYRMKKLEADSARALKGVEDMRDKLLLPRIATPEEIGAR